MMIHVHVFYCFKFCTHLGFNPLTELAVKYSMSWHFQWYGYQFFNSEFKNMENKKPFSGISEPFKINTDNRYIWKCSSVFQSIYDRVSFNRNLCLWLCLMVEIFISHILANFRILKLILQCNVYTPASNFD